MQAATAILGGTFGIKLKRVYFNGETNPFLIFELIMCTLIQSKYFINNDTLLDANPTYLFEENDTFTVMQVVYNTYPECADTAYRIIKTFKPITVHIPNVITPNQDATNDNFMLELTGGEFIQWNIVNRWGQLVAQGEKELALEKQDLYLWDGLDMHSHLPVNDGVYFYEVVIRTPANVVSSFSGSLTVVR